MSIRTTDHEINQAIAELCGYVWYRIPKHSQFDKRVYRCLFLPAIHEYEGQSEDWLVRADGSESVCTMEYMAREGHVPNYCSDLNAVREVVMSLMVKDGKAYLRYQQELIKQDNIMYPDASARQRCEAILKVLKPTEATICFRCGDADPCGCEQPAQGKVW